MLKKKHNFLYVIILFLTIIICFLFYYIFLKKNEIERNIESIKNDNYISQEKLVDIIYDELFIFFRSNIKSLKDITNNDKQYSALYNLIPVKNEYYELKYFSKYDLEKSFSSSSLAKLGIEHSSFDVYAFDGDYYRSIDDSSDTFLYNLGHIYEIPIAEKVSDFYCKDVKCYLSVNFIFSDISIPHYYGYGRIEDIFDDRNRIIKFVTDNDEFIDVSKYLDENYESIKENMTTYNYVFIMENDNIYLIDFYIN